MPRYRWLRVAMRIWALVTAVVFAGSLVVESLEQPDALGRLLVTLLLGGLGCLAWPHLLPWPPPER